MGAHKEVMARHNRFALWVMGRDVLAAIGPQRFVLLYLAAGTYLLVVLTAAGVTGDPTCRR